MSLYCRSLRLVPRLPQRLGGGGGAAAAAAAARAPSRFFSDKHTSPPPLLATPLPLQEAKGHVLVLSLNRPQARNALSRGLVSALSSTFQSIHNQGPTGP